MLRTNLLICLTCLIAFSSASAADWPQWAGPRRLWSRDLAEEFGATYAGRKNIDIGYPSSPIAYKNSVIVPLGRSRVKQVEPGRSLMALDQTDGRLLRKRLGFDYGMASPMLIELAGQDPLVLQVTGELIGVDPGAGRQISA